jgi:hypothetical protein
MDKQQSATERFKSRVRPKVSRSEELMPSPPQQIFQPPQSQEASLSIASSQVVGSPQGMIEALEAELESLPKVMSHFQLRFEEQTKDAIQERARKEDLTAEVLLEGIWEVVKDDPLIMEQALLEAKERSARRQKASKLKNAITRARRAMSELGS